MKEMYRTSVICRRLGDSLIEVCPTVSSASKLISCTAQNVSRALRCGGVVCGEWLVSRVERMYAVLDGNGRWSVCRQLVGSGRYETMDGDTLSDIKDVKEVWIG